MDAEDVRRPAVLLVIILLALKATLIPSYTSTDFEVHRNWMAVTWNRPLEEWYKEETSEWTLDYPPYFAFFELLLANLAVFLRLSDELEISKEAILNERILYFQRISVMAVDLIYLYACWKLSFGSTQIFEGIPKGLVQKARLALFTLLACNQALFLVDSVHFQYNGLLTALLLLSVYYVDRRQYILGALLFSVLVNFKHIYVYYAFAYVAFYLWHYFEINSIGVSKIPEFFGKCVLLSVVLVVPFVASLGPFIVRGGLQAIENIIKRLFPISRGLTHAFWAPNFWALYNFADLLLYRTLNLLRIGAYSSPTYTSGLVQEYEHSVLPNVSSMGSSVVVIVVSIVVFGMTRRNLHVSGVLTLGAFAFFFFGYHVHEKAIILITVPLTLLPFQKVEYLPLFAFTSTLSSFALFPLLFTPFEVCVKYALCIAYFLIVAVATRRCLKMPFSFVFPTWTLFYYSILVVIESYATFIHRWIFAEKFEFLPLMAISVSNAIGVAAAFCWMLILSMEISPRIAIAKKKCLIEEEMIRSGYYSVQAIDEEQEVRIVAGVDVSCSKTAPDFAVVALSVFSYPNMQHLATFADTLAVCAPYVPDYFAIRESEPIVEFVKRVVVDYPQYRPDVILCDGNGQFHPRRCGMACHIGAKCGIATIGVSKNLLDSVFKEALRECSEKQREAVMQWMRELVDKDVKEKGFIPFDVISPVVLNVVRLADTNTKVFVSAGYGIDVNTATKIVLRSAQTTKTCQPIREV